MLAADRAIPSPLQIEQPPLSLRKMPISRLKLANSMRLCQDRAFELREHPFCVLVIDLFEHGIRNVQTLNLASAPRSTASSSCATISWLKFASSVRLQSISVKTRIVQETPLPSHR